jgi:hypothetical protein
MAAPVRARLHGTVKLGSASLPSSRPTWPIAEWFRCRLEVHREALQFTGAVTAALLWFIGVTLLVHEVVSWWAELESFGVSNGADAAWDFYRALE